MQAVETFMLLSMRDLPAQHGLESRSQTDLRSFHKIFHATAGTCVIRNGKRLMSLSAGDIVFQRAGDSFTCELSENGEAYICLFRPESLLTGSVYLQDLLRHFPFYVPYRRAIRLNKERSRVVRNAFEGICGELESSNEDKWQAIALHLQMVVLQTQRAGRNMTKLNMGRTQNCFNLSKKGSFSYS